MAINLPDLPNGLKLANTGITPGDHQGDTLIAAFNKFNNNARITLTENDPLAGRGLVWNIDERKLHISVAENSLIIGSAIVPYSTDHFYIENGLFKTKLDNRPIPPGRLLLAKDHVYVGGCNGRAEEIPLNFKYFGMENGSLIVNHQAPVYVSDIVPVNPDLGDLWWNPNEYTLRLYVYELGKYTWRVIYSDEEITDKPITPSRIYLTKDHILVGNCNDRAQQVHLCPESFCVENGLIALKHRAPVEVSPHIPAVATLGNLWYNPDKDTLNVYVVNDNVGRWVEAAGGLIESTDIALANNHVLIGNGATAREVMLDSNDFSVVGNVLKKKGAVSFTQPSNPDVGDMWFKGAGQGLWAWDGDEWIRIAQ